MINSSQKKGAVSYKIHFYSCKDILRGIKKEGGVFIQNSRIIRGIQLVGGVSYRIFLERYYLRHKKKRRGGSFKYSCKEIV